MPRKLVHGNDDVIEWIETLVERGSQRAQAALVMRLHPELRQIERDEDRHWAIWFASEGEPAWRRLAMRAMVLAGGPALVTLTLFIGARTFDERWRTYWEWLLASGWATGLVTTLTALIMLRHRRMQRRYFLAMRIFGQDVCTECGYEMNGHVAARGVDRRCPECAAVVPPRD